MKINKGNNQENENNEPNNNRKFMWVSWILSAIVLFLCWLLVLGLANPVRLMLTGKKTTGVVITTTKGNDSLLGPVVQFETLPGVQVSATPHSTFGSFFKKTGERVTLLYDPKNPHTIQLLSWHEFPGLIILLGLIAFVVCGWISAILIAPKAGLDDPLHILSFTIARLNLSPIRFPLFFLFSLVPIVIFGCGLGAYLHLATLYELKVNGIKVKGVVTGSVIENSDSSEGSSSGIYNTIVFTDLSGNEYTIRESRTTLISPLKQGDSVEVIYSPGKPENGVINRWFELYPAALFFGFFFIAMLTPIVLFLKRKIFP